MITTNNIIKKIHDVTPIPTEYNKIVFRSRLESRWAKFFDIFSIPYEYESEGFQEGDKMYLPDFYLPTTYLRRDYEHRGVYLEIKPEGYDTKPDHYKWDVMKGKNFIICFGNPPPGNNHNSELCLEHYPSWDNDMRLMKCPICKFTKFEFNEGSYRFCKNKDEHQIYDLTTICNDNHMFTDNRIFNYDIVRGFI